MRESIDEELADLFSVPGAGTRLRNLFVDNNIKTMSQLLAMKPHELLALRHFGQGSCRVLERVLAARGLRLGEPPPPPHRGGGRSA
jgi:DNA-directed RNA polymerase alpha subunit